MLSCTLSPYFVYLLCFSFVLKPESSKKRANDSAAKTPVSTKKAKIASPKSGNLLVSIYLMWSFVFSFLRNLKHLML